MAHRAPLAVVPRPARAGSLLVRFLRAERGATAVEFGIIAAPFIYMMMAILELAIMFWCGQVLETAVANASRQIYTGQFQTSSTNANKTTAQLAAQFKSDMCTYVTALFNCSTDVSVDIRSAASWGGATPPSASKNGAFDTSGYSYQTIAPKQIGIVTAAMQYKRATKILPASSSLSNGNILLMATSTFMVEPYTN